MDDKKTIYEGLAACIRSGQIEDRDMQEIFKDDPEFAEWYRDTYLRPDAEPDVSEKTQAAVFEEHALVLS